MNRRERVLAAFDAKEVDRVPVGFWFHFTGNEMFGEPCIQAHLNYYQHSRMDYAKIMCDGYFRPPMDYGVKMASDWRKIRPVGRQGAYIADQLERAKRVNEALAPDRCTLYNIFAPFSVIRWCGEEMVMAHLREDPESVMEGMKIISQDVAELSRLVVEEAGCTGIYFCLQGGEKDRFTEEEYRSWIAPSELSVLHEANRNSPYNMIHCCGWAGDPNRLELWSDYPAKAVNWAVFIENMSLAQGREFFHGKTVAGGFDNRKGGVLYSGTKEEVQAFTRRTVEEYRAAAGDTRGLILGADCTISPDVDFSRFDWVVQALEDT